MGFLLRRLAFYVVAFFVAACFNFALPRLMPGDPVDIMFAQADASLPPEAQAALRATFGFVDGPLSAQFWAYLQSVFTWDLGISVKFYPLPVADVLGRAVVWTLFLVGTSTLIAFALGTVLGIVAAWWRGGRFDSLVSPLSLVLQSVPAVVVSLLALFAFAVSLRWLPPGYAWAPELDPGWSLAWFGSVLTHAVLPLATLTVVQIGGYLVTIRNSMINLLGEDYITLGRAKGLSEARLMLMYGARNAILPMLNSFAITIGAVMGGSLITEIVFNYPGLGNTLYQGIIARDYPLIQGQLLIMTLCVLAANFIADLANYRLDPRLRTE